jgi:hypothetical protein
MDYHDSTELRQRALECKTPVGVIACPNCGVVCYGAIHPVCGFCEKFYWSNVDFREVLE